MTMKTQPYKIYGMQQKQFLERSSQQHRPCSKNKKNLKHPNLLLKRIRKKENKQNLKVSRRKEVIKIREKNKIEILNKIEI